MRMFVCVYTGIVLNELICGYAKVAHTLSSFPPHTHTHTHTICGPQTNGAKSGYCGHVHKYDKPSTTSMTHRPMREGIKSCDATCTAMAPPILKHKHKQHKPSLKSMTHGAVRQGIKSNAPITHRAVRQGIKSNAPMTHRAVRQGIKSNAPMTHREQGNKVQCYNAT